VDNGWSSSRKATIELCIRCRQDYCYRTSSTGSLISLTFVLAVSFFSNFVTQMRLPVFFTSLFFIVLGINVNSYARVELHTSRPSPHIDSKKASSFSLEITDWDNVSTNNSRSSEEDKILVCEDEEDDDVNNLSLRKFRPVVSFDSILFYQSRVSFCETQPNVVPFVWRPISRIYILQRNLRIWFHHHLPFIEGPTRKSWRIFHPWHWSRGLLATNSCFNVARIW
jgi:hypothetical protein